MQTKCLRERIIELEKRGVSYCGIYQRAAVYRRGDICTVDGSMYVAINNVEPGEEPGKGGNWVLSSETRQRWPRRHPFAHSHTCAEMTWTPSTKLQVAWLCCSC